MERALLITVDLKRDSSFNPEMAKEELKQLSITANLEIVEEVVCHRDKIDSGFFIGSGKVEEITNLLKEEGINVVIFNNDLSSTQQRNLEDAWQVKTIDRTQLILDIFAKHAQSQEGKLQVELAQLEYLLPRLTGKGIMLSRLGGGVGTRGPGEQKLEADRRRIREHIVRVKDQLKDVRTHRQNLRKKRTNEAIPVIALVGYTNAGKSTLLNALTNAGQIVRESLFTTLDPLSRVHKLKNNQKVIFSDTVGFLERLPHGLIEAFKATLEEVKQAHLLIHCLDISHPQYEERAKAVNIVLNELGVEDKPMITALNKIDKLTDRTWLERLKRDFKNSVAISAKLSQGLPDLEDLIIDALRGEFKSLRLSLPLDKIKLVDLIYQQGKVKEIKYTQESIEIDADLPINLGEVLKEYEKE
jgi:GTP-binding protein HflX